MAGTNWPSGLARGAGSGQVARVVLEQEWRPAARGRVERTGATIRWHAGGPSPPGPRHIWCSPAACVFEANPGTCLRRRRRRRPLLRFVCRRRCNSRRADSFQLCPAQSGRGSAANWAPPAGTGARRCEAGMRFCGPPPLESARGRGQVQAGPTQQTSPGPGAGLRGPPDGAASDSCVADNAITTRGQLHGVAPSPGGWADESRMRLLRSHSAAGRPTGQAGRQPASRVLRRRRCRLC